VGKRIICCHCRGSNKINDKFCTCVSVVLLGPSFTVRVSRWNVLPADAKICTFRHMYSFRFGMRMWLNVDSDVIENYG
jgi:hypothetical protein